jgi:hypothetical protein
MHDVFVGGEILKCGSVPKLGGPGASSPRKILKYTTSETVPGGFRDHIHVHVQCFKAREQIFLTSIF